MSVEYEKRGIVPLVKALWIGSDKIHAIHAGLVVGAIW